MDLVHPNPTEYSIISSKFLVHQTRSLLVLISLRSYT